MKKLVLSAVVASAMIFSAQTVTAQESKENQEVVEQVAQQQDDFVLIEVQELPAEVQQAVERDFEGALISEAYVKEKEGEKEFKLKITTQEGEEQELYADEQGNWIDKDKKDE